MQNKGLFRRIKEDVDRIPVIDLHSHLRQNTPNAQNLGEIIFYHLVKWELIAGGIPEDEFSKDINDLGELAGFSHTSLEKEGKGKGITLNELIPKYLPYFKNLRNTTTHYCLKRIFNDLYNFDFSEIDSNNWKSLSDKVLKTKDDDEWTKDVLLNKAKINVSVTGNWQSPGGLL